MHIDLGPFTRYKLTHLFWFLSPYLSLQAQDHARDDLMVP